MSISLFVMASHSRLLFTEESVLPHTEGEGEASFKWHKRTNKPTHLPSPLTEGHQSPSSACSSLFIEPVEWMEELLLGNTEGKVCLSQASNQMTVSNGPSFRYKTKKKSSRPLFSQASLYSSTYGTSLCRLLSWCLKI